MKICRKCNVRKKNSEFNKKAASKDGLQPWCRQCSNKHRKIYHRQKALAEMGNFEPIKSTEPIEIKNEDPLTPIDIFIFAANLELTGANVAEAYIYSMKYSTTVFDFQHKYENELSKINDVDDFLNRTNKYLSFKTSPDMMVLAIHKC